MSENEALRSYEDLWRVVAGAFNGIEDLDPRWEAKVATTWWTRLVVGEMKSDPVHYEWIVREKDRVLDVCLHFEFDSKAQNDSCLRPFAGLYETLAKGEPREFAAKPFGEMSTELRYRIPLAGRLPTREQAVEAAHLMKRLIDRTYPILRRVFNIRD